LTSGELEEVLKVRWNAEKREYLRFGLVAATVVNVNRRRGAPLVQPDDFFRERPKEADYMGVEEAQKELGMWAASLNAGMPQPVEGLEGNTL
jgi:hypothetical protein